MSIEEFKTTFKPGDFIQGWATKKVVEITGIGETRFFFKEHDHRRGKEFAQTIRVPWLWVKVDTRIAGATVKTKGVES